MQAEQITPQTESVEAEQAVQAEQNEQNEQTANATMGLCRCGCGSPVPSKSFYRPGHDSRHVGQVAREVAESDAFGSIVDELPTRALQLKAWNMAYKLHTEAARRARKNK